MGADRAGFQGDRRNWRSGVTKLTTRQRAIGAAVVAGTVERQIAGDGKDCGCGFVPGSAYAELSKGWYACARASFAAAEHEQMLDLTDRVVISQAGKRFAVIHGGLANILRFSWPTSHDGDA